MKKLDAKVILFNAAAAIITIGALVGVLRSYVFAPSASPCTERYLNVAELPVQRAGVLLTAADLQSGLGGRDAGLLENLTIGALKGAPTPHVLNVNLPQGSAAPFSKDTRSGGISFPWQPRAARGKTAACLSYSLLLPSNFEFNNGGVLPGIRGSDLSDQSKDSFVARLAWRSDETGGADLRVSMTDNAERTSLEREAFPFPRGKWVKLELETILNAPKQQDGILRAWLNGKLVVEATKLVFRDKPGVAVSGVSADVFYGADDYHSHTAPKDTQVSLTPFDIRWQ